MSIKKFNKMNTQKFYFKLLVLKGYFNNLGEFILNQYPPKMCLF